MFAVSILGVYIISNYFTATFTSVLSIPIFKASVNSIEDLANSGSVKALLFKGSNTDEYIMVSSARYQYLDCIYLQNFSRDFQSFYTFFEKSSTDHPIMTKIGDKIRRHPERRILNAFSVNDISTIVMHGFALPLV